MLFFFCILEDYVSLVELESLCSTVKKQKTTVKSVFLCRIKA